MQKQTKKRLISMVLAVAMAISQMTPLAALADELTPAGSITEPAPDEKDSGAAATTTATNEAPESEDGDAVTASTPATTEAAPASETESDKTETQPAAATPETAEETAQNGISTMMGGMEGPGVFDESFQQPIATISEPQADTPMPIAGGVTGAEPEIIPATTMQQIRAGGTNFGAVTFARGEGHDNTITVTVNENTRTYGDEFVQPGITVTLDGTEHTEEEVLSALNSSTVTMYATAAQDGKTVAGDFDAYVVLSLRSVTIGETNYSILDGTSHTTKLHINTKQITVTAKEQYQQYGMDQPELTYWVEGLINGDQLAGKLHCATDKNTPTGDYDIDQGDLNHPCYTITFKSAKLHVVQNTVVITPMIKDGDYTQAEFSREYGTANPEFTYHLTGLSESDEGKLASGEKTVEDLLGGVPVIATDATWDSAPGDYPVRVTLNSQANGAYGDYSFVCPNNATLHVTTRRVNVLVNSQEKTYGDEDPGASTYITWGDTGEAVKKATNGNPYAENGSTELQKIAIQTVREPGEDVGTYAWNASISDVNTNTYYSVSFTHGTLEIKQAKLTVHVADVTAKYGDARQGALDTSKGDNGVEGFKNGDTYESVFGKTKPSYTATGEGGNGLDKKAPVGEYTLNAEFEPQKNYYFEYVPGTLTVTKRPLTITVTTGQKKTYGQKDPSFTTTFSGDGKVEGDFIDCVVTRTAGENVGMYDYHITQFEEAAEYGNYDVTFVHDDRFEITKKTLTVIVPDATKVYGEENPDVSGSVVYEGFVNDSELGINDSATNALTGKLVLTHEATKTSPVGEYKITASGLESANYDIVYQGQTNGTQGILTITPLHIMLVGNTLSRKYGVLDSSKGPNYTIYDETESTILSVVDPEGSPLNVTASCPEWSDVSAAKGSYPVTVSYEPNNNYVVETKNGTCVITEGDVTVIVDSKTFVYGDKVTEDMLRELTVTGISSVDGTKTYHNGDLITNVGYIKLSITGSSNVNATLDVGNYDVAIEVTPLPGKEHSYTIDGLGSGAGRLSIARRPVTFTVTPGQQKQYGDNDPTFSVADPDFGTWDGGNSIANPAVDLRDAVLKRVPGEIVGLYAFTRGTLDDQPMSKNYNITLVNNSFEIIPRDITGTIQNVTKTYGDVFDKSGYEIVWDNFLDKSDEGVIDASVQFVCLGAAETAEVGSYTIGATYATNRNYNIHLVEGQMNVEKRPITLTFYDCEKDYGDHDPSMLAPTRYTVTGNMSNIGHDTLTLTTGQLTGTVEREPGEDVREGGYAIKTNLYNKNYDITYRTADGSDVKADGTMKEVATLTINPVELTVTVEGPYVAVYGNRLPTFTVSYNGFKRGDTAESVLQGTLRIIDVATGEELPEYPAAGHYDIRAEGLSLGDNPNYILKFVDSTLDVVKRKVTVTIEAPEDAIYGEIENPDFTVTATTNNGDGTHGAVVEPDSLGLTMDIEYAAPDENMPEGFSVEPTAVLEQDIAADGAEDGSKFLTTGIKHAGTYTFSADLSNKAKLAANYDITFEGGEGSFTISRKDLTTSMPDMEKYYGTETVLPELTYEGFAFDETAESVPVHEFEIKVADEVAGRLGDDGEHEKAFVYEGGVFGDYNYLPCDSKLTISHVVLEELLERLDKDVTIKGVTAESDGELVETEDNFSETWALGDIIMTPPEGYLISTSDSLDEDNVWGAEMVVSMAGEGVVSEFYLMDAKTGAITTVGTSSVNVDQKVPAIDSVDVAASYDVDEKQKLSLLDTDFRSFSSAAKVFITGVETDAREVEDEDDGESENQGILLAAFLLEDLHTEDEVPAISTCSTDPNSGIFGLEYYTVPKSSAKFDEEGKLVVDESLFKDAELTFTDPNSAHADVTVNPDFVGYIVTRTRDVAGRYSDPAVASISVIAPKAAPAAPKQEEPKKEEEPEPTPTPAPAPAPLPLRQSRTGISILELLPLVGAIVAVAALLVYNKRKSRGSKATDGKDSK